MYKVLIADDEAIIRKGLCHIIDWNEYGFEIAGEAPNGREALKFINENDPDLVMIDIKMPNLHGLEAIKIARENGFTGRFIILSGFSDFAYAKEAISLGVVSYLTKPVDEDELINVLKGVREELDSEAEKKSDEKLYMSKARETLLKDLILGDVSAEDIAQNIKPKELALDYDIFQVLVYEKYSYKVSDKVYNFADLLQVSIHSRDYDFITINNTNIVLLKGKYAVEKFTTLTAKYTLELPPEKNSPLDTLFITCGRKVSSIEDICLSYNDAQMLLSKRFFCDQYQHIVTKDEEPRSGLEITHTAADVIIEKYTADLVNHIQSYNRNKIAESLHELQDELYATDMNTDEEKNLLVDLYLHIKEKIFFLYKSSNIPFIANSEAINFIQQSFYLYEIIAFLSTQFEMIMSSIGYSSRDSIIDDIVHYIDHNYSENITLENIAPLFGYNSSYLGKIFSKKLGINFNTYLDNIRIEHSKELLLKNKIQVYKVAEMVGYRNVDYFHIKFKKSTGMSPAEYRRKNVQ